MIEITDEVQFFRERATSHADLLNDAASDDAFVALDQDEAITKELSGLKETAMVMMVDSRMGGYVGAVEMRPDGGLTETLQTELMIVETVDITDYAACVTALEKCKRILFDVLLYMHTQKGRCFKFSGIRHYRVGPVFQNRVGWAMKFEREGNIPFTRTLDTDVWTNEP